MNIRQRVFDCFPDPPATISLLEIMNKLAFLAPSSVYGCVRGLVQSGHVEPYGRATFRRLDGVSAPVDLRGGKRANAGRPRGS